MLDFAKLVRHGDSVLPSESFMKGHLIWHSTELSQEPYDITRNSFYLNQFDLANAELARLLEVTRLKAESEAQARIDEMVGRLWRLVKEHFIWHNPQTEKSIPLDGKLRWEAEKSIAILGSGGMKHQDFGCRADGSEVDLKPILATWIKEYAAKLLQDTRSPNLVHLTKDILRAFPFVPVRCGYADKLVHPKDSCSIFKSGSSEALHCDTIKLELRPS